MLYRFPHTHTHTNAYKNGHVPYTYSCILSSVTAPEFFSLLFFNIFFERNSIRMEHEQEEEEEEEVMLRLN